MLQFRQLTRRQGGLYVIGFLNTQCRGKATSSNHWKERQSRDSYVREARTKSLRSRAGIKLEQVDDKYNIFRKDQVVVDLGFAPGSWSQVAFNRTRPNGYVVGIDLLPVQPPHGVSAIHGDFLRPSVQDVLRSLLHRTCDRNGTPKLAGRVADSQSPVIDVLLSDMSVPTTDPSFSYTDTHLTRRYHNRLSNTTGIPLVDHVSSMGLCHAALDFAQTMLKRGGHFVCKFYQGSDDTELEAKLLESFDKVHREKPESSRKESREMYFVALKKKNVS